MLWDREEARGDCEDTAATSPGGMYMPGCGWGCPPESGRGDLGCEVGGVVGLDFERSWVWVTGRPSSPRWLRSGLLITGTSEGDWKLAGTAQLSAGGADSVISRRLLAEPPL